MKTLKFIGAMIVMSLAIIGIVSVVMFFVKENPTDTTPYEKENIILRKECDSLQIIVTGLQTDRKHHFAAIDSLKNVIHQNTLKINENRKKYEEDIARLFNFSDNEHLQFFSKYLESN